MTETITQALYRFILAHETHEGEKNSVEIRADSSRRSLFITCRECGAVREFKVTHFYPSWK